MVDKARQGFTLIELLVVIAIIGILLGFLAPGVMRMRGKALRTKCQNNMRQLYLGIQDYRSDHHERFPDSLDELYDFYLDDLEVFQCPASGNPVPASPSAGDYELASDASPASKSTDPLAETKDGVFGEGGTLVLRIGGQVVFQPEGEI